MSVCRQLGYSKQAYYQWCQKDRRRCDENQMVKEQVLLLRRQMPRLGTRKLHYLLKDFYDQNRIRIGRDKLFCLLDEEGLLIKRKKRYVKTTDSKHWMRKYPDLRKELCVERPEQLWVSDITYLPVIEGHSYLHLVTDAYSKKIMGYVVSEDLSADHTAEALRKALSERQYTDRLMHHSDRGLQYCSSKYTGLLKVNEVSISMTEDGSPYDNAVAERVNGILKEEFGLYEELENIKVTRQMVAQAVKVYNGLRPHLSNHLLTPDQMHQQSTIKPKRWSKKSTKINANSCAYLSSHSIY